MNKADNIHSSIVCGVYALPASDPGLPAATSRSERPLKSKSSSRSASTTMMLVGSSDSAPVGTGPSKFSRTSSALGPSGTVTDCFRAEPLVRRDEANNELVESLETRDRADPLDGPPPGL
jgi:hypothetical protein